MVQRTTPYGFSTRLRVSFEQAVPLVTGALQDEGFGVLTETLETDLDVGLLLPCNVVVYEDGPGAVVSIADPVAMLDVIRNPALRPVAEEAKARLTKVLQRLSAS